jgi:branched-chain amino acid:cation transporter, LIVCS family
LNALPETYASKLVYRGVTITVLLFSIPDFMQFFASEEVVPQLKMFIPLSEYSLGWVVPSIVVFCLINISELFTKKLD